MIYQLFFRSNCDDNDEAKSLFNKSEMLRLWKGLHYCFWMSDKPLVQEELAEKIASIMHCFKVYRASFGISITNIYINRSYNFVDIASISPSCSLQLYLFRMTMPVPFFTCNVF